MSICPDLLALDRSPLVRKLQRRQARLVFRNRSLAEVEFFVNDLDALEQQDENDQFGHSGTVANKRSGEQCPPLWNSGSSESVEFCLRDFSTCVADVLAHPFVDVA